MTKLQFKVTCCQGEIACHFWQPISVKKPLLLTVPGGPGISARYLDNFLVKLAERVDINIGIIDLPNHDESIIPNSKLPLSYQTCLDFVIKTIQEIVQIENEIILYGQSFGARLVFDAIPNINKNMNGIILMGLPYVFESSISLQKKINQIDLESIENNVDKEEIFNRNWRKILPLYTAIPLQPTDENILKCNTRWMGNEQMLDNVPSIEVSAEKIHPFKIPLTIIQGDRDLVVPDNNLVKLQELVPQASFYEIANCGHFPMLEHPEAILSIMDNIISSYLMVNI